MELKVDFTNINFLVAFILAIVVAATAITVIAVVSRRVLPTALTALGFGTIIFAHCFGMIILEIISAIALLFVLTFYCVTNAVGAKSLFQNAPRKIRGKNSLAGKSINYVDTSNLYQIIAETVKTLASTKTGALITFQKKDDLKPFIKNGVDLGEVPVTKELLLTIFYPGTRLHDGAVIIRDNKIISASVYYALSTKPITGKMGSRHRAAIGISEQSDSITVVVSEETGRISIVEGGSISHVLPNEFLNVFTQIMNQE